MYLLRIVVVVVRVDPLVVCDDAVGRHTLGLIALVVIVVSVVAIFLKKYTTYRNWP